jgi:F-type H+-transporting ATPase subunit gamma
MRNRIKAIETIEKVTHAMQLISMSTHVRLREKKTRIEEYQQVLTTIFNTARAHAPAWNNSRFMPQASANSNPLIILVGSQKGLCGTFNTHLFEKFEKDLATKQFTHASIITVGKKAIDYLERGPKVSITFNRVGSFNEFNFAQLRTLVSFLRKHILEVQQPYSQVLVYSNYSSTFFTTKHQISTLIPFTFEAASSASDDFIWEEDPNVILNASAEQLLDASLYILLTKSLLAEQAARFVSMDNSTRNAKNLRDGMKLQYNKIRQAKITKELTELSTSFQQDLGT